MRYTGFLPTSAAALFCLGLAVPSARAGFTTIELGPGDEFTVQNDTGTPLFNVDSAGNVFPGASGYARTVIVSPVGTDTQNGTALLDAMAGITTASAANPFLVHVEPGIYDLAGTRLDVKSHVDLQGSGQRNTVIRSIGAADLNSSAVVQVVDESEVRNLTIENTGGDSRATGYFANGDSVLRNVTIRISGAVETGSGIVAIFCDSILVKGVTVEVSGSGNFSIGADFLGCTRAEIADSIVSANDGGAINYGIRTNSQETVVTNVTANAAAAGSTAGMGTDRSNTLVRNSSLSSTSTSSTSRGLWLFDGGGGSILYTVEVHGSQISGQTAAANTTTETDALFGASQLVGGFTGAGNKTCAGVYDGTFTYFAGTCP